MAAKVKNPRKKFLWQITFVNHPLNPYLFQKVNLPEITIEQVEHGDVNRSVKTAGRVTVGNMSANKLETTSGSDTWLWDWLNSCQDMDELAEDGVSILNSWICEEVWPCRINGQELDRMSSDNTIEDLEFSVGICNKL